MKRTPINKISKKQQIELAKRQKLKRELIQENGLVCKKCGKWDSEVQLSHTISLARGGKTERSNCRLLCISCHLEGEHNQRIIIGEQPMWRKDEKKNGKTT